MYLSYYWLLSSPSTVVLVCCRWPRFFSFSCPPISSRTAAKIHCPISLISADRTFSHLCRWPEAVCWLLSRNLHWVFMIYMPRIHRLWQISFTLKLVHGLSVFWHCLHLFTSTTEIKLLPYRIWDLMWNFGSPFTSNSLYSLLFTCSALTAVAHT